MLAPDQLAAFLLAAIVVTVSPGPDNLMVLAMGMAKGRSRGIAFGLGCALGCLGHTALAVIGVSALIAASPLAFTALRIAGGLYLLWLGIQALRSRGGAQVGQTRIGDQPLSTLFFKGVFANVINPKVSLFFIAFLPQFVISANGNVSLQLALLGLVFTVQGAVLFGLLGYFAGTIGQWLQRKPRAGMWLDRVAGSIFVALGLRLIVTR